MTDLAELLGRRTTIDQFLADLVDTVADHLNADVCSVYLYDVEQDLLVLRATRGLNPELVGKVRLAPGEGLTGHAFLKNSPVLERNTEESLLNKTIPDLGEEQYPSFLGVPIKRGELGIGVLTLQYRSSEAIDDQALRTLRAIASHLAATLENAAALYEAQEIPRSPAGVETERFESGLLNGTSASRGIAIGLLEYLDERVNLTGSASVRRSMEEAVELSASQLGDLQKRVDETLSDVAMMIFSSHLLMLRDASFAGRMIELAREGMPPLEAVQVVVDDFARRFSAIPDPRFQEKVQDVQDLGHRIARNLLAHQEKDGDYRGHVVVARDVFPSELVKLHLQNVEGLAFCGGGATSHVAILAQSLGLPMVATADPRLFAIPSGVRLVVDAEDGKLVVDPAPEILEAYRGRLRKTRQREEAGDHAPIVSPVLTADGVAISILANVNLVKDARTAHKLGAEEIGLYRSEFPFLIRNGFPTEEEQVTVYRRVVEAMEGRPVCFRTMDLGGDKLLGSQIGREDNPFLGFRGIRFLLEHRDLFRDQLRAMLRAGEDREIGIQFPMVVSIDEFLAAREEVNRSIASLRDDGLAHNHHPKLGIMVELPATTEIMAELAAEVEFFSIGTNDLTMYMLGADRTNHRVASLYRSPHPGILRALARVTAEAIARKRSISVCGADAADPAMALFYLGIGIRRLSVDTGEIIRTGAYVREVGIKYAEETAARMLAAGSVEELGVVAGEVRKRFSENR